MMGQARQRVSFGQRRGQAMIRNKEKQRALFEAQLRAREERLARLKARAAVEIGRDSEGWPKCATSPVL